MKKLFSAALCGLIFISGVRCGTEIGNPSILDTNVGGSDTVLGYLSNTGQIASFENLAKPTSSLSRFFSWIRGQSTPASAFDNAPLLKVLTNGTLEPAIRIDKGKAQDLPKVVRLSRLANGNTYVLFDSMIDVEGSLCHLIEIGSTALRCIDSEAVPALIRGSNYKLKNEDDKRNFLVAEDASGNIVYKAASPEIDVHTFYLAARTSSGVSAVSDQTFSFDRVGQRANGDFVGFGCLKYDAQPENLRYFAHCLISSGQVVDLSSAFQNPAEITNKSLAFPLKNDKVLLSLASKTADFHLRVGPMGEAIALANYSTDLKNNFPMDMMMERLYLEHTTSLQHVFEGEDGTLFGAQATIENTPAAQYIIDLTHGQPKHFISGYSLAALEAEPGESIILSVYSTENPSRLYFVDPLTFSYTEADPQGIKVTAARYFGTAKAVLGGPTLSDPNTYKYVLYDFTANQFKTLFTSSSFVDIHAP